MLVYECVMIMLMLCKSSYARLTPEVLHKACFVKSNGRFYNRCKQVGHIEQDCKNKNKNANASSIKFDSCYLLTKGANSVKDKFIGAPIVGSKKEAIWVPKSLVTNLQGSKKVWVPQKN